MGKRGGSSGFTSGKAAETKQPEMTSYEAYPYALRVGRSDRATPEEKAQRLETRRKFMAEAQVGDRYRLGAGMFGPGGEEFEIVDYGRSPNGKGIRAVGSSRPVAMSAANVDEWIRNGATLVSRKAPEAPREITDAEVEAWFRAAQKKSKRKT